MAAVPRTLPAAHDQEGCADAGRSHRGTHPHRRRTALRDREVARRRAGRALRTRDLQRDGTRRGGRDHPALRGCQGLQTGRGDEARGGCRHLYGDPVHHHEPRQVQFPATRTQAGDRRAERPVGRRVRRRRLGQGRGRRPRGHQGSGHRAPQVDGCPACGVAREDQDRRGRVGAHDGSPRGCRPSRRWPTSGSCSQSTTRRRNEPGRSAPR